MWESKGFFFLGLNSEKQSLEVKGYACPYKAIEYTRPFQSAGKPCIILSGEQCANSCCVFSGALGLDAYVWHLPESLLFVSGITKPSLENDCEL